MDEDNLIEDLKKEFTSAEEQSGTQEKGNVNEEQPQAQTPAEPDEWMDAPKAYTKEYQEQFKALPLNWRKYLTEREKQAEKGFSDFGNKINGYKWIDDVFTTRQDRLSKMGYTKAQDYINALTAIDDELFNNPRGAIDALAKSFNVNLQDDNEALNSVRTEVQDIRQQLSNQQDFIRNQEAERANRAINEFVNAKDEAGNVKHTYFDEVRSDMANLIKSGVCQTLEDAYERAVWGNKDIREKMISAQSKAELDNKVFEANKAKQASFTPKSKSTMPEKDMDVRSEIEAIYNGSL